MCLVFCPSSARRLLGAVCLLLFVTFSAHAQRLTFTTLAGPATGAGSVDGTGTAARFANPGGVAVDAGGNVYVADTDNQTIRKITPAGVVTTFAGLADHFAAADGSGGFARFNRPLGMAADSGGTLYV